MTANNTHLEGANKMKDVMSYKTTWAILVAGCWFIPEYYYSIWIVVWVVGACIADNYINRKKEVA